MCLKSPRISVVKLSYAWPSPMLSVFKAFAWFFMLQVLFHTPVNRGAQGRRSPLQKFRPPGKCVGQLLDKVWNIWAPLRKLFAPLVSQAGYGPEEKSQWRLVIDILQYCPSHSKIVLLQATTCKQQNCFSPSCIERTSCEPRASGVEASIIVWFRDVNFLFASSVSSLFVPVSKKKDAYLRTTQVSLWKMIITTRTHKRPFTSHKWFPNRESVTQKVVATPIFGLNIKEIRA